MQRKAAGTALAEVSSSCQSKTSGGEQDAEVACQGGSATGARANQIRASPTAVRPRSLYIFHNGPMNNPCAAIMQHSPGSGTTTWTTGATRSFARCPSTIISAANPNHVYPISAPTSSFDHNSGMTRTELAQPSPQEQVPPHMQQNNRIRDRRGIPWTRTRCNRTASW